MAWTEYVQGVWTPKRVSPGSLTVENSSISSITDVCFDIVKNSQSFDIVASVRVYNPTKEIENPYDAVMLGLLEGIGNEPSPNVFGSFAFVQGQAIQQSKYSSNGVWAPKRPLDDRGFQTVTCRTYMMPWECTKLSEWRKFHHYGLVWIPPPLEAYIQTKEKVYEYEWPAYFTWTLMSHRIDQKFKSCESGSDSHGPHLGFAVSAKHTNGSSKTYFNLPITDPFNTKWDAQTLKENMDFVELDHPFSHDLMKAAGNQSDPLRSIYDALAASSTRFGTDIWGARDGVPSHELGQPSAIYNWELGVHAIMLAVDRFHSVQQFDEALEIARLVFDPTTDFSPEYIAETIGGVDQRIVSLTRSRAKALEMKTDIKRNQDMPTCWRFPPFQDVARKISLGRGEAPLQVDEIGLLVQPAVIERQSNGALIHSTARGRPEAYMKWIVMKYIEMLIDSGDVYFRRSTLESLPLAIQRYVEAAHVLGQEPPKVPQLIKRNGRGMTFKQLKADDVKFELEWPFSPELQPGTGSTGGSTSGSDSKKEQTISFLKTNYFGVVINPKFKQIRDRINQRLYNIRNNLDIQGQPITYSIMEPLIDPGALLELEKAGFSASDTASMIVGNENSPLPRHRFEFIVHGALELCEKLSSLGERLLASIEKRDMETFSRLRAQHATQIQRMMLDIRNINLDEARQTIESLNISRETEVSQLAFYLALTGEPNSRIPSPESPWIDIEQNISMPTSDDLRMSYNEKEEMDREDKAAHLNEIAQNIDTGIAPLFLLPSISVNMEPMGVGTSLTVGTGSSLAAMLQAASNLLRSSATSELSMGSRAARKAQLIRQLQERRLLANLHGREIKSIDKQIEMQQTRIKAVLKDIDRQQAEVDEAAQIEEWYRTKYTNEQLYSWVEKSSRGLYYQAYSLAISAARRAESALGFEQGRTISILRPGGYWDASRDGLLAADPLYLDLKRLESAYLEGSHHDYEITKTVSLRQIDPLALMRLRISGTATFTLNETLFDMDFPGHYMRRIRSVSVSIPALIGPYASINATLTLVRHKYRVSILSTPEEYAATATSSASNDVFRTDHIPISSIAISSGSHDAGVFELAFKGPRYVPFEGAGAISTWRLDLPTEMRSFDYGTISDVLLHVSYTSLDGGALMRSAANSAVRSAIRQVTDSDAAREGGLWEMFDLRNDFSNEWYAFKTQSAAARKGQTDTKPLLDLGSIRTRLPFWARDQNIEIKGVSLVVKDSKCISAMTIADITEKAEIENLDTWSIKSWNGLSIKEPWKWRINIDLEVAERDLVDNVYMLLHYVLGKKGV